MFKFSMKHYLILWIRNLPNIKIWMTDFSDFSFIIHIHVCKSIQYHMSIFRNSETTSCKWPGHNALKQSKLSMGEVIYWYHHLQVWNIIRCGTYLHIIVSFSSSSPFKGVSLLGVTFTPPGWMKHYNNLINDCLSIRHVTNFLKL